MNKSITTFEKDYFAYQVDRPKWRKILRKVFLYNIKRYVKGDAIDYGCGVGELLVLLSKKSIGFELNEFSVNYCKSVGLNCELTDINGVNINKLDLSGKYTTFILYHVLEHLENPDDFLKK